MGNIKKMKQNNFLPTFSQVVVGLLLGILLIVLVGCEKEYSQGKNHEYIFSALVVKDQWGVETWGSHHFITDEPIENIDKFKECYVNYLKWSGLDKDGLYNEIFYTNSNHVRIRYRGTTYQRFTIKPINNCL